MTMPDVPSPFRRPAPAEQPWWWLLLDADGAPVTESAVPEEYASLRFGTRADAESWIGEHWREVAAAGVAAVALHQDEQRVSRAMSLAE